MMSSIPSWVVWLFLLLLYLGIKACFKRVIRPGMLIAIPLVFIWFSVDNLHRTSHISKDHLFYYLIGALFGLYFGHRHVRKAHVRADMHQHIVEIPGDWTIMLIIMAVFFVQLAIHTMLTSDPALTKNYAAMALIIAVSGLTTGMVVARNLTYFHKYTKATHEHLTLTRFRLFK